MNVIASVVVHTFVIDPAMKASSGVIRAPVLRLAVPVAPVSTSPRRETPAIAPGTWYFATSSSSSAWSSSPEAPGSGRASR